MSELLKKIKENQKQHGFDFFNMPFRDYFKKYYPKDYDENHNYENWLPERNKDKL